MTNRSLRRQLLMAVAAVFVCLALSAAEYVYKGQDRPTFVSSNATLFAIIFAAYIAYLFQQRSKSVDDLRRWWNEVVQAKSDLFVYCDKAQPTEDEYLKAFYKLSTAMDTLRLIYCNVGRTTDNPRGFYPFEQVRDLVDIARSISPSKSFSFEDRKKAKIAFDIIFQSLRHAIQFEASATPPDAPTLYEGEQRAIYIKQVLTRSGIDVESVRRSNKS